MSVDRPSRVQGAAGYYDTVDPWDRRADDILSVERLTSWCRKHIEPPPAAILYDAVNAIERLRRLSGCHPRSSTGIGVHPD